MFSGKRYLSIALSFVLAMLVFSICAPRAVHAITATLVQVVNTAANPVAVQPVPAKQAVRLHCNIELPITMPLETCVFKDTTDSYFVVPAAKRLVVDFVSSRGGGSSAKKIVDVWIATNGLEYLPFPVTSVTIDGQPYYGLGVRTTFYADPETSIAGYLFADTSLGEGAYGVIYLEGHLEDVR